MLRLEDIVLSVGGNELLSGVSWHLRSGDRVGLVGRNGSGKTTLIRAIVGEIGIESGHIHRRGKVRLGYLPQQAVSGSTAPLWDEVRTGMDRLNQLQADLIAAERALEEGEEGAVERHAHIDDAFRLGGGYTIEERIGEVLSGLGFSSQDWHRTCDTFSGGWQMRIALARLLLSEPDVLLLDEPTNHLDLHARSWLAGFLSRWPGAVVIVSHDRHILDRVCTRIVEVRRSQLHVFTGNFSYWLRERELRMQQRLGDYEAQKAEIERLERFIDRFRYKANKAAQAQSRQKQLDKIKRLQAPSRDRTPVLRLPDAPMSALEAVTLKGATIGWPDKPAVLQGVDLVVERGVKLAVLGLNGSGKSTLLRALAGRHDLDAGRRTVGRGVRIGYFTQDLAQELPFELTALEHLREAAPAAGDQRARDTLGALGLSGDAAMRPIGGLSGGERARVALAVHVVRPRNLLLLDEPTNHLDAVTVTELIRALQGYEGALLLVTHDRFLVESVATHVAHVRGGQVVVREGVQASDFELARESTTSVEKGVEGALGHADRKRLKRLRENLERRVVQVADELEVAEAALEDLDGRLAEHARDRVALADLAKDRARIEKRIADLYADWERCDMELSSL